MLVLDGEVQDPYVLQIGDDEHGGSWDNGPDTPIADEQEDDGGADANSGDDD